MTTRVLLDGRALGTASAQRGIGTYVRNLLDGLAEHPELDVTVLLPGGVSAPAHAKGVRTLRVAPDRFRDLEHELWLPLDLRRARSDVVHSPALDPPALCTRPWVQTIHDVVPLTSDAPEHTHERRRWRRWAPRLRRAAAVVAVSRWSADAAVAALGLDPARVHVVPHGVSDRFVPGDRRGGGAPYVLFVGEWDPRKRHALAFAAAGALADAGLPHELRVTGRIAPWYAERLQAAVRAAPRPDRIRLLGHVAIDDLVRLYQDADAVLVTSEAEGFGFPALEAMACGTPVVGFANSATTEVVGDGGLLVADGDVDALSRALRTVVTDPGCREELAGRALQRARSFSWKESVRRHREIYEAVTR